MILPCPIRSLQGLAIPARHLSTLRQRSAKPSIFVWPCNRELLTFFLNCLWIASSASLMVTPFKFRAVTSRPRGKCKSIFFTGGVVRSFFSASRSSIVVGDVFNFLCYGSGIFPTRGSMGASALHREHTNSTAVSPLRFPTPCLPSLLFVSMQRLHKSKPDGPRSAMLYTPVALELALRWPFDSVGDDERPETPESTLLRSEGSPAMMVYDNTSPVSTCEVCTDAR